MIVGHRHPIPTAWYRDGPARFYPYRGIVSTTGAFLTEVKIPTIVVPPPRQSGGRSSNGGGGGGGGGPCRVRAVVAVVVGPPPGGVVASVVAETKDLLV
jgi:hypothetical protein